MDLPQLGLVAVLLVKSRKSAACLETPSVTLLPLSVAEFEGLCRQFEEKQLCTLVA